VRIAAIAGFEKTVESLGGDLKHICVKTKLTPDLFSHKQHDKFIPLDKLAELLMNAAIETNNEHFGLILGQQKKSSLLGVLGLLVRDAENVKLALEALVNNLHIHAQNSISIDFSLNNDQAVLSISPIIISHKSNQYVYDLIIGCMLGLLRSLCGDAFRVAEIRLGARDKQQLAQYKVLLNTRVKANQPRHEIVFPVELLDLTLKQVDPQYKALLQDYKSNLNKSGYRDTVKSIIRDVLAGSNCNIDYVSQQLNFNKRTLNRKLATENTTFQDLVSGVKKDEAKKLLSDPLNSITKISQELGYSETSSFTNAFKSWFGTTPKKWQNQYKGSI